MVRGKVVGEMKGRKKKKGGKVLAGTFGVTEHLEDEGALQISHRMNWNVKKGKTE